jgi:hypothetical protein
LYGLEMAFDDDYEDLAQGHLLFLMAIARAIDDGRRSFNFNGNYAHYKSRMGGVVTTTAAVQVFRTGSVPWIRARLGELRRRLRPPPGPSAAFNPERRRVSHSNGRPQDDHGAEATRERPIRPPRAVERGDARDALTALESTGVRVERLSGAALEARLPFCTRKAVA